MTLEQELLKAAERADYMKFMCTPQAVGDRWRLLQAEHEDEAAALRARAIRVRELMAPGDHVDAYTVGWDDAIRALTGDLPTPTPAKEGT